MNTESITAVIKSNSTTKTRAVRSGAGIGYDNIGSLEPGVTATMTIRKTATANGEFGFGSLAGDIWWYGEGIKVKEDNTPRKGWIAEIHKGEVLLDVTLSQTPDPEPQPTPDQNIYEVDISEFSKKVTITSNTSMEGWTCEFRETTS